MDPEARIKLSELIINLRKKGMTIIVSSHILAELEDYCSDMLVIRDGEIKSHVILSEHQENQQTSIKITANKLLKKHIALIEKYKGVKSIEKQTETSLTIEFEGNDTEQTEMLKFFISEDIPIYEFGAERNRGHKMIIITPEFHRQLWLNFSAFRLISMPFIMSLIIYVFAVSDLENWQSVIIHPALYSYYFCVFVWGNYVVAHTTSNEVNIKTWDFQRMSSIGPWELTIGKLFGSTSYVWYTGGLLLSLIAYCFHYANDSNILGGTIINAFSSPIESIVFLILTGILGHTISFWATSSDTERKKAASSATFVLGCALSFGILPLITAPITGDNSTIHWHFWEINQNTFVILSLLYFVSCAVMASQRNIRDKLQFKSYPFMHLIFFISLCIYATGYIGSTILDKAVTEYFTAMELENYLISYMLFVSFIVFVLSTYILVFSDAHNLSKYKRCLYAFKNKEWKRFFQDIPAWVSCAAILLLLYFTMIIQANMAYTQETSSKTIFAFATALLFFIARDGLIYHSIRIGKIERHKAFLIIIYLLMIYLIIPTSLAVLGRIFMGHGGALPMVASFFYPMVTDNILMTVMPIIYQTVIACAVLYFVLKNLKEEQTSPAFKIKC